MSSLKDVSLKDVGPKDVSLKDVVVPFHKDTVKLSQFRSLHLGFYRFWDRNRLSKHLCS